MKNLRGRIEKLEIRLSRVCQQAEAESCICGKVIMYHTSYELELILAERCPVHGVAEPKFLMHGSYCMPLDPEYRKYCKCPPDAWRAFLEGKRPRPTMDELMDQDNARRIPQADGERAFQEEHARIKRVIARHEELLKISREGW
jgi:hypothetical protein